MNIRQQYDALCAENDALRKQQEKVTSAQEVLVASLRQRAKELADVSTEFVEVKGSFCFSERCKLVGEKWVADGGCWCVAMDEDGRVYTASSGDKGYKFFSVGYNSELGDATVEELNKHFKPLFDE